MACTLFDVFLQDGAYTYSDFVRTFEEYEIQRVMRAYENSITINLHCCSEGDWQQDTISKEQFSELCQVPPTQYTPSLQIAPSKHIALPIAIIF